MLLSMVVYLTGMVVSAGAASRSTAMNEAYHVTGGDTLWAIASSHCSSGDVRAYIYDLKDLNHLDSDVIYSGQVLLLP